MCHVWTYVLYGYNRETGASSTTFPMPILLNSGGKVYLNLIFGLLLNGRLKNTEHLQPFSETVQIKWLSKCMKKVFSAALSFLLSSVFCFFPFLLLTLHIYHTTFSSQLFYFMTLIKMYSNTEELSGVWEQITATGKILSLWLRSVQLLCKNIS